ncbi:zinc finger and SCAN domain-containing protein 26-like [Sabethes cyaneus]|uniref:zinc finger and SCAN domain-containing protein 26-like n=1 Tax=Sabethes cyaneus TaxID=53552 RepID=UPI00237E76F0|nr:zinc finger and SCAN domain-containing protein 26-like [Sabethes cyaneus]
MERSTLNLSEICRFCLSGSGQLFLLFGLHKDAATVIENVRLLTTIELSTADNVDYKICVKCCTDFEQCLKFRHKCMKANDELVKTLRDSSSYKSPLLPKEEVESSSEPPVVSIDQLFDQNAGPVSVDQIGLEQYGLVTPLFLESASWPEPPWMAHSYEMEDQAADSDYGSSSLLNGRHLNNPINSFELQCNKMVRSKYYCKICEKHFFQRNVHLQHHQRYSKMCFQCLDEKLIGIYQKELASVRHTCRICLMPKENCAEFLQHAISHHAEEHRARDSYKCDQCDKVFMLKSENGRGRIHNCVRKLRCPHCPQTFYYAKSYQKHLRFYHNVDPLEETGTRRAITIREKTVGCDLPTVR